MRRSLLIIALAACSPPNSDGASDGGGGGARDLAVAATRDLTTESDLFAAPPADLATPSPPDLALGPYPSGPYGHDPGDTVAPLTWEGYVVPAADRVASTVAYGRYGMDELRRSGSRYALVHVAEFY